MKKYLGIDLGGTKTAVCIGAADGTLVARARMATQPDVDPAQWKRRVATLIADVMREAGATTSDLSGAGVALPGPMSVATRSVLNPPNLASWRNVPVGDWIEEITGLPVAANNDANAAGLAEFHFGDLRGTPDLVYLTMSTGIGAGVITGGRLLQGATDHGGEVGHFVIDAKGPPCPCGQNGCFELYCGGRNFVNHVARLLATEPSSILSAELAGPEGLTVSAIARAAQRGDVLAFREWQEFLDRLAQGLGIVAMCYNPSAMVLGTIAIHLGDLLIVPLRERLTRFAWPGVVKNLVIRPSALGPAIGELGSLAVAISGNTGS